MRRQRQRLRSHAQVASSGEQRYRVWKRKKMERNAIWCIPPRGGTGQPASRQCEGRGVGGCVRVTLQRCLILWMAQACALSQAASRQRHPGHDRRHPQRYIALTSPRRRRLTLSPPEVAQHLAEG